jgi:hypothetical protein
MKEVTTGEVVAYARKSCKHCHGSGSFYKWIYTDPDHMERERKICKCAASRFEKANKDKIQTQPDGAVTWKEAA